MIRTHSCGMHRDSRLHTHLPLRMPKPAPTASAANLGQQSTTWAGNKAPGEPETYGDAHPLTNLSLRMPSSTTSAASLRVQRQGIAGYVASSYSPVIGTYTATAVIFTVPFLNPTASGGGVEYEAAIGEGTGIVDDGIDSFLDPSGNQINNPFLQILLLPGSDTTLVLPLDGGVQAGDQIYAYVDSNLNGDGVDTFYIQDNTTGAFNSYSSTGLSNGATAECVLNPDPIGPGLGPLPDFGGVLMQCGVYANGSPSMQPIGDDPTTAIDMVNPSGVFNAVTTDLFPGGLEFGVSWDSAQTG